MTGIHMVYTWNSYTVLMFSFILNCLFCSVFVPFQLSLWWEENWLIFLKALSSFTVKLEKELSECFHFYFSLTSMSFSNHMSRCYRIEILWNPAFIIYHNLRLKFFYLFSCIFFTLQLEGSKQWLQENTEVDRSSNSAQIRHSKNKFILVLDCVLILVVCTSITQCPVIILPF